MVGQEKNFQNGSFNMAGKRIFEIGFCKYRTMLQIFYAEYTESVLDILSYPESTVGPPWLGQEKHLQNAGSQKPGTRYVMIGFCKCSKCFL